MSGTGGNFKSSRGEQQRKAEKNKYKKLAYSHFIDDLVEKIKILRSQIELGENSEEAIAKLDWLISELPKLNEEWRAYTDAYVKVTRDVKKLKEESQAAGVFQKHLKTVAQNMKELHVRNYILQQEFLAAAIAQLNNIQGHYEEMHKGSLDLSQYAIWFKSEDFIEQANMIQPDPDYWYPETAEAIGRYVEGLAQNPATLEFKYVDRSEEPLFPHEPSPNDIVQGTLGDCFFVASLSAICAADPHIIRRLMKDNGETVTVPVWEADDYGNILSSPKMVTVKKTVPAAVYHMQLGDEAKTDFIFGKTALWVQMMEKAYAASGLHKKAYTKNEERNFGDIDGGTTLNALSSILGKEYKLTVISDQFVQTSSRIEEKKISNPDELFEFVKKSIDDGDIMVASAANERNTKPLMKKYKREVEQALLANQTSEKPENEIILKKRIANKVFHGISLEFEKNGDLREVSGHAYAITDTYEKNGKKYIVVRNPLGKKGFNPDDPSELDFSQQGYCAIPVEEFKFHFYMTASAKPLNLATARENHAAPFARFTEEMYKTICDSVSIKEDFIHMSDEFESFFLALQHAHHMCQTEYTSNYALSKAYKKLSEAAQNYIDKKKDNTDISDKRNLRIVAAKACIILADSYNQKGNPQLVRELQKGAGKMMLEERMKYCIDRYGNPAQKSLSISENTMFKAVVDKLEGADLVSLSGNKADKLPKLLNSAYKDIKEIEAKQKEQPVFVRV